MLFVKVKFVLSYYRKADMGNRKVSMAGGLSIFCIPSSPQKDADVTHRSLQISISIKQDGVFEVVERRC